MTRGYSHYEDLAEMYAADNTRQGRPTTKTEALDTIFDIEDLSAPPSSP